MRRERFKAGDTAAEVLYQLRSPVIPIIPDRKISELTQMAPLGQPKRVRIARQAFDIFSTPLEIGAASERLEILLSVRQSDIGCIVNGRSITQASVDLGVRLKGGIETGKFAQHLSLPSR